MRDKMTAVQCPSCGKEINVPEKKTGLWWGIGCLVAALAIPVILAVIGLLAAIAIPSFMRARDISQLHACVNNMRIIEAAKEQAALQKNYNTGDSVTEVDISQFLTGGLDGLSCPKGGNYTVNSVGLDPECSVHGQLSGAIEGRRGVPNQ